MKNLKNGVIKSLHINEPLLSREMFKEEVFKRDNNICVVCGDVAVDAHHIIERHLWEDGGYYKSNGVSVCSRCHLNCEKTHIQPKHLRQMAGITNIILPPNLKEGLDYDKWGNEVLSDSTRKPGPLFEQENVQKAVNQYLYLFRSPGDL